MLNKLKLAISLCFICIMAASFCYAARPILGAGTPSKRLRLDIDKILDTPDLKPAIFGAHILNLRTGKVLYSRNAHKNQDQ